MRGALAVAASLAVVESLLHAIRSGKRDWRGSRRAFRRGRGAPFADGRSATALGCSTTATTPTPRRCALRSTAAPSSLCTRSGASCWCSARCASSARPSPREHDVAWRGSSRARCRDCFVIGVGGEAAAIAEEARERGLDAHVRQRCRASHPRWCSSRSPARDLGPRQRVARRRHRAQSCGRSSSCAAAHLRGGAHDLRAPLSACATTPSWLGVAQRPPLHPVPRHHGDDHRDAHVVRARAVVHPRAAEEADRSGRAQRRPRDAHDQGAARRPWAARSSCCRCSSRPSSGPILRNPFVLATTAVTAGYGVIGYLDDYLKIKQELGRPLRALQALRAVRSSPARSIAFTLSARRRELPADWLRDPRRSSRSRSSPSRSTRSRCRSGSTSPSRCSSWSQSNAVNLTDGLDGLAIGPVMINAGTYLIWAYIAGATFLFKVGHAGLARRLPRHPPDRVGRRARGLSAAP